MLNKIPLPLMMGSLLAFWAVTFFLVHGVAIVGYVAMQLVTTGVFVYGIQWADKRQAKIDAAADSSASAESSDS